jgi:hypothetical protein
MMIISSKLRVNNYTKNGLEIGCAYHSWVLTTIYGHHLMSQKNKDIYMMLQCEHSSIKWFSQIWLHIRHESKKWDQIGSIFSAINWNLS